MYQPANQNRSKIRMALLAFAFIGLAVSAGLYFLWNLSSKHELAKTPPAQPEAAVAINSISVEKPKTLGIVEEELKGANEEKPETTAVVVAEAPRKTIAKKTKASTNGSRRHLAHNTQMKFPAPANLDLLTPTAEVEMWSGTKKSVVFVPPGSKFE